MASKGDYSHLSLPKIPLPDYDNFEFESKETPEFIAKIRATLQGTQFENLQEVRKPRDAFGLHQAAPSVVGRATAEAISFLSRIKNEWLQELLFDETLNVYEDEKIIGTYSVLIFRVPDYDDKCIFHVTIRYASETGEAKIEEIHDGLVTTQLETICQKHSYSETGPKTSIDNKNFLEIQPNGDVFVTILNSENEMVTTWLNIYRKEEVKGFVSECSHLLLSRLFASDEVVPENFDVLGMDSFGHFQKIQYRKVTPKMLTFRPYKLECFGFTREFARGKEQKLQELEEYFLNRRLFYRKEQGRTALIKRNNIPNWNIPNFVEPVELQIPPSVLMEENWFIKMRQKEMQFSFKEKFANTVAKYPQLTQALKEMTHLILTVRPDDVFAFVNRSFRNWKNIYVESASVKSSGKIVPLQLRQPEPQANIYQLLRSYGL